MDHLRPAMLIAAPVVDVGRRLPRRGGSAMPPSTRLIRVYVARPLRPTALGSSTSCGSTRRSRTSAKGWGETARSLAATRSQYQEFVHEWRRVKTRRCLRRLISDFAESHRVQRMFAYWVRMTFDPDHC